MDGITATGKVEDYLRYKNSTAKQGAPDGREKETPDGEDRSDRNGLDREWIASIYKRITLLTRSRGSLRHSHRRKAAEQPAFSRGESIFLRRV